MPSPISIPFLIARCSGSLGLKRSVMTHLLQIPTICLLAAGASPSYFTCLHCILATRRKRACRLSLRLWLTPERLPGMPGRQLESQQIAHTVSFAALMLYGLLCGRKTRCSRLHRETPDDEPKATICSTVLKRCSGAPAQTRQELAW